MRSRSDRTPARPTRSRSRKCRSASLLSPRRVNIRTRGGNVTDRSRALERRRARQEDSRRRRGLEREAAARARVRLAARATPPERVVLHLGPTNSGKTHDAIEFLVAQAERGLSGTY